MAFPLVTMAAPQGLAQGAPALAHFAGPLGQLAWAPEPQET